MLEHLIATQKFDLEIDDIKSGVGIYSEKYHDLQVVYDQKDSVLSVLKKQHLALVAEHDELAEKLNLEKSRLEKSKARLNEIKTNFEFHAMKREVDLTERANEELQTLITQKATAVAELATKVEAMQLDIDKLKLELTQAKSTMDEKYGEIESLIESKQIEKKQHEEKIDRAILGKYRLIRERKFPDAIAEISSGACQGCFMSVPPQMAISMAQTAEISQCPYCQRLLYKRNEH